MTEHPNVNIETLETGSVVPSTRFGIPIIDRAGDADLFRIWPEELLDREVTTSLAPTCHSKRWKTIAGRCGDFLNHILCQHHVGPKDGPMFFPGELEGKQKKNSEVRALHFLTYDLDRGQPALDVIPRLEAANTAFLAYSSHSHQKLTLEIPVSVLRADLSLGQSDPTDAEIQHYLAEQKKIWPDIARTARLDGIRETESSPVYRIRHCGMDKYRILFPLAEPFLISDFGNPREAAKVWSHCVAAIGAKLDIQFDPACLDLSRAYYTPRHPASAPYFVCMGGELPTDLAELPPCQKPKRSVRPRTAKRQSSEAAQPLTSFREFLRDHGDEFDVVAWVRSIGWEIRGEEVEDKITILCPNDHAHSNAGDPNDVGCVVMNPPETDIGRAVITCRHGHCHDLKTADFMKMIATELAPADGL